jgi:HK97 gp10 family phage protein
MDCPMTVQIQVEVDDQATPMLEAALEKIQDQINAGLDEAGQEIVIYAQQIVPVRTGFLRSSIGYEVADGTLIIRATAKYAAYVEWGTRRARAQPYIRPSIDAYMTRITSSIIEQVLAAFG